MGNQSLTVKEAKFQALTRSLHVSFGPVKIKRPLEQGEADLIYLAKEEDKILSWVFCHGKRDLGTWYNLTRSEIPQDYANDLAGGTKTAIITFKQTPNLVAYYKVVPRTLLEKERDAMVLSLEKEAAGRVLIHKKELEQKVMNIQCIQSCFPSPPDIHFYLSVLATVPYAVNFKIICPKTTTSINFQPPKQEWETILRNYAEFKEDSLDLLASLCFKETNQKILAAEACKTMNQNSLNLKFSVDYRNK